MKAKLSSNDHLFYRVLVGSSDRVWFLASDCQKSEAGIAHSKLF